MNGFFGNYNNHSLNEGWWKTINLHTVVRWGDAHDDVHDDDLQIHDTSSHTIPCMLLIHFPPSLKIQFCFFF